MIDDAFKERDPQRHCAMKGLPGRVSILEKPFSENLVLKHSCCPHVFVDFSIVCEDRPWSGSPANFKATK